MIQKTIVSLIFILLFSTNATAQSTKKIEVFDVSKGEVIMKVDLNRGLQKEVKELLDGITDVYKKLDPIPKQGFMIKVPLDPNVMIENQWLQALVDEVIIIFPNQETPYFLVFDDENSPHFFMFDGETDRLLEKLKLKQGAS